jgi:hypothetical protein
MKKTLIQRIEVPAGGTSGIVFDNIPNTFTDLKILFSITTTRASASDWIFFKINDSTANQSGWTLYGTGTSIGNTTGQYIFVSGNSVTANTFASSEVTFPNYAGSTNKSFSADSVYENNSSDGTQTFTAGLWSQTAPITKLELYSDNSATIKEFSSAALYGITAGNDGITTVS